MLQWLRRTESGLADRVARLEAELQTLQRRETEREATCADQLDAFRRLFKRLQQRDVDQNRRARGAEPGQELDDVDPITRSVLRRRAARRGGGNVLPLELPTDDEES